MEGPWENNVLFEWGGVEACLVCEPRFQLELQRSRRERCLTNLFWMLIDYDVFEEVTIGDGFIIRVATSLALKILDVNQEDFEEIMKENGFEIYIKSEWRKEFVYWKFMLARRMINKKLVDVVRATIPEGGKMKYFHNLHEGQLVVKETKSRLRQHRRARLIEVFALLDTLDGRIHHLCAELLREEFMQLYPSLSDALRLCY